MFPDHQCAGSPALGPLWKILQKKGCCSCSATGHCPAWAPWGGTPTYQPHQRCPWSQKQQRCAFSILGSQPRLQQQPLLEETVSGEEGKVTAGTCSLAHLTYPWGTTEITGLSEAGWYLSLTDGRGWASRARFSLTKWSYGLQTLVKTQCLQGPPSRRLSASSTGKELRQLGHSQERLWANLLFPGAHGHQCYCWRWCQDIGGFFSSPHSPLLLFVGGGRGIFFYTAKFKIFFIEFPTRYYISWSQTKKIIKTSMMVQWLRVYLSVQRTWVQSLVQEDPTCRGAIRPVSHDYWAWALQPGSSNKRSHRSD